MIITPGYIFNAVEPVTHTKLNQLGNPTGALEPGDVTPDLFDQAELLALLGEGAVLPNYLRNGNFAEPYWALGDTAVACPVGQTTFRADWWFVRPEMVLSSGMAAPWVVNYSRFQDGPNNKSLHCANLEGASGVQIVDFGQDIPGHLSAALRTTVTFSFWLFNGTGAPLTPSVRFETANGFNDFLHTTWVGSISTASPAPLSGWTRFTFTADLSASPPYVNMTNGLRVMIRLPSTALNDPSKYVFISQAKLERGSTATDFVVERDEVSAHPPTSTTGGGAGAGDRNFLLNGQFAYARWGRVPPIFTSIYVPKTFGPESWFVDPAGGSLRLDRTKYDPLDPQPADGVGTGLKITGDVSVTNPTMRVGQFVGVTAAEALQGTVSFSIYLKNNATGGVITPTLVVDTCNSPNSFETLTLGAFTTTLNTCALGAWTRLEATIDLSLVTNSKNGFVLAIEIPAGSLNVNTKSIELAQAQLEVGVEASGPVRVSEPGRLVRSLPAVRNLSVSNYVAGAFNNTTVTASAAEMILTADDGTSVNTGVVTDKRATTSVTGIGGIDTTITNGWWQIWALSNGSNTELILSRANLSGRPNLPVDYRWYGQLGWVFRNAGLFRNFSQLGRKAWQEAAIIASGAADPLGWNLFDLRINDAIPPGAIEFGGTAGCNTNGQVGLALSPMGADAQSIHINLPSGFTPVHVGFFAAATYRMQNGLINSWRKDAAGTNIKIDVTNYELP